MDGLPLLSSPLFMFMFIAESEAWIGQLSVNKKRGKLLKSIFPEKLISN